MYRIVKYEEKTILIIITDEKKQSVKILFISRHYIVPGQTL